MSWLQRFLLPLEGSRYAGEVDALFLFLVSMSAFFVLLIAALAGWFLVRYRRRAAGESTPRVSGHLGLEIAWTVIPLGLVLLIFQWGLDGYRYAANPRLVWLEIHVTGKKWLWTFEYPGGLRTINELHVPVNRPVKLVLASEDVIHSFFVPAMRLKQDAVPGRYTRMWFTPTEPGVHQVFCAEYCGKSHSDMLARIHVETQMGYQEWLEKGDAQAREMPLEQLGGLLFESRGCSTCHTLTGERSEGPSFKGLYGHQELLAGGQVVTVDENYLRESILRPQARRAAGYEPVMPTFEGLLRERELLALIEFIKMQK